MSTLVINDYRRHNLDGSPKYNTPRQLDKNCIPPITDPHGRSWDQPDTSLIAIDDTHAVMTKAVFLQLMEYSGTYPSGVYEGKMWRRHDGIFDRAFLAKGGKPVWHLAWYGRCDDPKMVSSNYRKILLSDGDIEAEE
jgi:hypothetical protein